MITRYIKINNKKLQYMVMFISKATMETIYTWTSAERFQERRMNQHVIDINLDEAHY